MDVEDIARSKDEMTSLTSVVSKKSIHAIAVDVPYSFGSSVAMIGAGPPAVIDAS